MGSSLLEETEIGSECVDHEHLVEGFWDYLLTFSFAKLDESFYRSTMKIVGIVLLGLFIVLVLVALSVVLVGRRSRPTHEEVKKRFIYRDEPHADQLTQSPNRLDDNEVTRG